MGEDSLWICQRFGTFIWKECELQIQLFHFLWKARFVVQYVAYQPKFAIAARAIRAVTVALNFFLKKKGGHDKKAKNKVLDCWWLQWLAVLVEVTRLLWKSWLIWNSLVAKERTQIGRMIVLTGVDMEVLNGSHFMGGTLWI